MKKFLASVLICSMFMPIRTNAQNNSDILTITKDAGYDVSQEQCPKSSIVIDAETGDIIWGDNIDLERNPASMTKMMVLYLVLDAIKSGTISEETLITATAIDEGISKIYAISNSRIQTSVAYPVKELIKQLVVPSSNVATLMLANYLSNNDADTFLDLMNQTALELGMTHTKFYNATGAEAVSFAGYYTPKRYDMNAGNITTARDIAILTYYLLKKYPNVLTYTNQMSVTSMEGTPYAETFHSYNHSLPGGKYGLEGVDGLKTGSSPAAAYNVMATAKRQNTRLISIILGVGNWEDDQGEFYRHAFLNALFLKGFSDYEYKQVLTTGIHHIDGKVVQVDEPIYATVPKQQPLNMSVMANILTTNNGLTPVSNQIKTTEHTITIVPQKDTSVIVAQTTKSMSQLFDEIINSPDRLIAIAIVISIVLLVISLCVSGSKKSCTKKRHYK